MAKDFDNNTGGLFKNDKKEPGDKRPDYTGRATLNGAPMEVAAWLRDGAKGKWLSIKFSEPREQTKARAQERAPSRAAATDDEIPF